MARSDWTRPFLTLLLVLLAACANRRGRAADEGEPAREGIPAEWLAYRVSELDSAADAGPVADELLAEQRTLAGAAREAGQWDAMVEAYRTADALLARADELGVPVSDASTYASERAAALSRAREHYRERAAALSARGEREAATAAWRTVLELEPSDEELKLIRGERVRHLLDRGEAELEAGDPRTAYALADQALSLLPGGDDELLARAGRLRDDAFTAAARRLALLPPWRGRRAAEEMVDATSFLLEVDRVLHHRFASPNARFIALADPAGIHDTWNRMQYDGDAPTPLRAAGVGALYDAEIAATFLVDRVDLDDSYDSDTKTVRRVDGGTERYRLRTETLRMEVRCRLRLIDVKTRAVLREREIESVGEIVGYVADWDGDPSLLELNSAEEEWFDPAQPSRLMTRLRAETARGLADDLAAAIAAVFP